MRALHDLTAAEMAEAIRMRNTTAEALVDALLGRAGEFAALNSLTVVDADRVRAEARRADRDMAAGRRAGPLHGVPVVVKDNINTAGLPTSAGTPGLQAHVPSSDAPILQALLGAGAILFGKAGMHELAFGITSNNAHSGAIRNPYDPTRVPGGSSGGTAAAVGARIAPAGLGTDTGASIRLPANYCGVAGFRPGVGRWSSRGVVPISSTRDTPGPIARTVADLALLDGIVTGDSRMPARALGADLRIGVPRRGFWEDLDPQCGEVAGQALDLLAASGVTLVDIDLSDIIGAEQRFGFSIALFEFERDLREYLREHAAGIGLDDVIRSVASPDVAAILSELRQNAFPSLEGAYRQAMAVDRPKLMAAYDQALAHLDCIVVPTSPLLPPPIGDDTTTALNGVQVPTFLTAARNLGSITLAGYPSLSLPVGMSRSGLPVGLTFDAGAGCDRDLLALGLVLERLFPALPPPPIPQ